MTYGYNPLIGKWSPFHGALYAIVEAVAKLVALGGDYRKARLTLQEYFEKLGKDPEKWGKPFSSLLGAYYAQVKLGIPAIGGKDSMSGTFKDMTVPPTLVAFAVGASNVNNVVSTEFKKAGSKVIVIPLRRDENGIPDFEQLHRNFSKIHENINSGNVLAACTIKTGGLAEAISKMCFGNGIGFIFDGHMEISKLFAAEYGSMVLEIPENVDIDSAFKGIEFNFIGKTQEKRNITVNGAEISIDEALEKWEQPLEKIFPTRAEVSEKTIGRVSIELKPETIHRSAGIKGVSSAHTHVARPRIFMPVFPGTNCEYDTARVFEKAGGVVDTFVIKNLTSRDIEQSIEIMAKKIDNSQIIMLPGGFSGGDEPDGSGKFIATAFRNPYVSEAVMRLLKCRDGLILGICNGFQALIKLGLVPYGEIRDLTDDSPTLTFNTIGRHVSCMVMTRIVSNKSPWLANVKPGDIHTIPVSHGEGRFTAREEDIKWMAENGQIATQYVDFNGNPTYDIRFNPNGSIEAIEGITSPDGRVFGKMGHSERIGANVAKNVPGDKDQGLFEAGVMYFA